jgi:transcriptional regulator with XRE-family HTH domain
VGRKQIDLPPMTRDAVRVLGQQVRLARHSRNLTMAELAARAKVSAQTVSAVEQGSPNPSIGNVLNIAVAAGLPLFGLDDPVEMVRLRKTGEQYLALLPSRTYHPRDESGDGRDPLDF